MDNIAAVNSHDQEIFEDGVKDERDNTRNEDDVSIGKRGGTLCCCVSRSQSNNKSKYELQSSPEDHRSGKFGNQCATEIKSFLSSPVYCIFIIVATLCIFIVLFVELLIDAEFYLAGDGSSNNDPKNVAVALHWFAFAVLVGFFIELIFRLLAWSLAIFRDCISVIDGSVILIAFISNLCATAVAGPNSPFDSISLIIILRLIRIHSLITAKVNFKTLKLESRIKKIEEHLLTANCTISSLHRRIEEKDYEIRQLQAHLGSEEPRQNLLRPLHRNSNRPSNQVDEDLELAIALSRKSYEEDNNGGIVNKAFFHSQVQEEKEMTVLVHKAPVGMDSIESDIAEDNKVRSYMDEYFSNPDSDDHFMSKSGSGAIPKKRTLHLPIQANVNKNNNSEILLPGQNTLQMLKVKNPNIEPISVCIDPSILVCESPVTDGAEFSTLENKSPSQVPVQNINSQTSGAGSSEEYQHEIATNSTSTKQRPTLTNLHNKSGSFVSSESGYLSEDATVKKRLASASNMDTIGNKTSVM